MGRPRLYATSVERKAAWRRRHGMAVRPHYPSAAAKQAAYRTRKRQAAQPLAARECATIQQALQRGRGPISAGSCARLSMTGAGTRTCHSVLRRAAPPVSWPARAPTLMGWPRRACAGIGGRSSAWRTAGPPGEPRRARHATRAQTRTPRVCPRPGREARAARSLGRLG